MPWMPWAWFGPVDALLFFRCAVITKPWDALCDIRNVLIKLLLVPGIQNQFGVSQPNE